MALFLWTVSKIGSKASWSAGINQGSHEEYNDAQSREVSAGILYLSPGLKSEKGVSNLTEFKIYQMYKYFNLFVWPNKYEVIIHLKLDFTVSSNVKVLGKNAVNKYIAIWAAFVSWRDKDFLVWCDPFITIWVATWLQH